MIKRFVKIMCPYYNGATCAALSKDETAIAEDPEFQQGNNVFSVYSERVLTDLFPNKGPFVTMYCTIDTTLAERHGFHELPEDDKTRDIFAESFARLEKRAENSLVSI